jgi:hypothetical protein
MQEESDTAYVRALVHSQHLGQGTSASRRRPRLSRQPSDILAS